MMSISENDLELLEAYLDGELPAEARDALVQRLERDSALSAALEAQRAERFVRSQAFDSMAPDDRYAQQFAWSLLQSMKLNTSERERHFHGRLRSVTRILSTAAASIVIGFFVGWATRTGGWNNGASQSSTESFPAAPAEFRIPLTNAQGETIALQDFETPESAREFARRTILGVVVRPGRLTRRAPDGQLQSDHPALLISEVFPNTVASRGGLQKGDIILAFGSEAITDAITFVNAVSKEDGPAVVKILRGDEIREVTVNLQRN